MKQEELIAISGIVDDLKANPLSRSQRLLALSIGALKSMVSRRPKDKKPVYDVAIVAIAKNEREYIREWVSYHKVIGINKIYLYDNDSTDGMVEEIEDYIDSGYVVLEKIPGKKMQLRAYNLALNKYGKECAYMAFIDCDEFICPLEKGFTIKEMLDSRCMSHSNAGGVALNWCMFGSSGYEEKPKGLLIDNFIWRAKLPEGRGNDYIKTIVRPECVKKFNHVHFPYYKAGYCSYDMNGNPVAGASNSISEYKNLRINHYFTKSKQQWIARRSLGMADKDGTRTLDEFKMHDNNDVHDECIRVYSNEVKKLMGNL